MLDGAKIISRMVLNMIFFGKREALAFIEEWEENLSPEYRKAWMVFKERRDVVAKNLGLNEREILFLTVEELANFVVWDTKTKYNIMTTAAAKVRGNTEGFKILERVGKVYREYKEKCSDFRPKFDKEMAKFNNTRR